MNGAVRWSWFLRVLVLETPKIVKSVFNATAAVSSGIKPMVESIIVGTALVGRTISTCSSASVHVRGVIALRGAAAVTAAAAVGRRCAAVAVVARATAAFDACRVNICSSTPVHVLRAVALRAAAAAVVFAVRATAFRRQDCGRILRLEPGYGYEHGARYGRHGHCVQRL